MRDRERESGSGEALEVSRKIISFGFLLLCVFEKKKNTHSESSSQKERDDGEKSLKYSSGAVGAVVLGSKGR